MRKLAGEGNDHIRGYVRNGGVYFGICAGAYYACRDIVFEHDVPALRIENGCGLNLAEGRAVGTLYKEYGLLPYALTSFSAKVVLIRFCGGETYPAIYHGGPYTICRNPKRPLYRNCLVGEKLFYRAFILKTEQRHWRAGCMIYAVTYGRRRKMRMIWRRVNRGAGNFLIP